MFESLFQFLFDYRPHVFRQAEFRFSPPAGARLPPWSSSPRWCWRSSATVWSGRACGGASSAVLGALRLASLALILFCIFRPVLVVKAAVDAAERHRHPHRRLAQHADRATPAERRADFAKRTFANPDSPMMKALAEQFLIRTFRFSSSTSRLVESCRADVQRHADAPGQRDPERAPGTGGSAGVGAGAGHRRRGYHDRRDGRRRAARVEGGRAAGLHGRRRPGNAGARHPDRPRLDAADRAQGHVAAGRRHRDADRLCRPDGHARRRGRRTDRRLAAGAAAGRRRSGCRCACDSPPRMPARACSVSRSRRSPARSSPRTTSATSRSTSAIAASESSTSKGSRASR